MGLKRKIVIGVIALVAAILTGTIAGGYLLTGNSRKTFPADGYVLEVTDGEDGQVVSELSFSAETKYYGKFPSSFRFRDIEGSKHVVKSDNYIHYTDGSLSSFADGMTVNMAEVGKGYLDFYRVGAGMVMAAAGEGWEIDNNGNTLNFKELLWQLNENKIMTASDKMTLEMAGQETKTLSGALEIT